MKTSTPRRSVPAMAVAAMLVVALPAAAHGDRGKGYESVRASIEQGTLEVLGSDRSDAVTLRLSAGDPSRIEVDAGDDATAEFSFVAAEVAAIRVDAGNGDDRVRIDDANGAFTGTARPTRVSGGIGDDALEGGQVGQVAMGLDQVETYSGGPGADSVDGGKGADTAFLGSGNDSFRWDPGEGSDVIDGRFGLDRMLFNGAPVAETVTMSANGGRLTFSREPAAITMDTDGVEIVRFNAFGGADAVTVNTLRGTDVRRTNLDLAAVLGGTAPDGTVDNVVVNGTDGKETLRVAGNGSGADVSDGRNAVSVTHADPTDTLSVNTLAGRDNVIVRGVAGLIQVLVDGVAV